MMDQTPKVNAENVERGRFAGRPGRFSARAWGAVLRRVWLGIGNDNLSIVAAGVAFFGMLAIFPAITALISIYGLIRDPNDILSSLSSVRAFLPGDVFDLIQNQISQLISAGTGTLGLAGLISIFFALWSARAGVTALMTGLNIVYNERDDRNIVVQYISSLLLTCLFVFMAIISVATVVVLPALLRLSDFGAIGTSVARVLPVVILGCGIIFVIGALYRLAPHRRSAKLQWVTPGAGFAALLWIVVSMALSTYFSNFADFNKTYGSLGAIMAVLFWLYASAFVVLLGAELNAQLELQTSRDTTSGPQRPIGERQAFVADHVSE
ncbi:MAG: YihY/virulence factor BrkB family protein [Rhodobacteraceae bacterium]|nr:YihY/virulence factor BrkB family protein [Paracoccaceae bacterium]